MCLTPNSLLMRSCTSRPSNPFRLVAKGWSCQACMFSTIVQDGQPVEKPHLAPPEAMIFFEYSSTCFQVCGGLAGSSPAFWKTSLL